MKSRLLGAALASGGKRRGNRLAPYALHPMRPNFIVHERSSLLLPWPDVADTAIASARSLSARSALWRRGGVRPLLVGGGSF
ncbi:MAG: hypothetical protein HKM02_06330 [Pseudomonadales bacterium]|nr:hypothetical protein [Pseudomonadales bacterium]